MTQKNVTENLFILCDQHLQNYASSMDWWDGIYPYLYDGLTSLYPKLIVVERVADYIDSLTIISPSRHCSLCMYSK